MEKNYFLFYEMCYKLIQNKCNEKKQSKTDNIFIVLSKKYLARGGIRTHVHQWMTSDA